MQINSIDTIQTGMCRIAKMTSNDQLNLVLFVYYYYPSCWYDGTTELLERFLHTSHALMKFWTKSANTGSSI